MDFLQNIILEFIFPFLVSGSGFSISIYRIQPPLQERSENFRIGEWYSCKILAPLNFLGHSY